METRTERTESVIEKHVYRANRQTAKLNRMKGKSYMGFRRANPKNTNKVLQDVPRERRIMGLRCQSLKCKKWLNRACNSITEEERHGIYVDFWQNMSWESKKAYVCGTVIIRQTKQKTTGKENSRRNSTFFYHLKVRTNNVPVCREMYLSTLGLKKSEVHYWLNNFRDRNVPMSKKKTLESSNDDDKEDLVHSNQPTKKMRFDLQMKILTAFLESLPTLPSHYCRKTSNKRFLQSDIKSWSQLYLLYSDYCKQKTELPVARSTFDRKRREKKLEIYILKKDKCDTCCSFERKQISVKHYEEHIKKKEAAREEKSKDKLSAENGDCHTICCDLMAVQPVPALKASSAYFKLKLTAHNFTVYNLASHDAMCYWFDETQATLVASTFASCLCHYVNELLGISMKGIIIYSDGCSYQNRNVVLSNALLHLSMSRNVTIIQKYLEKGHTQMECDSVHSMVERNCHNTELYIPSQYVTHTVMARKLPKPYCARLLDHTFFKDYSDEKFMIYSSIRPGKRPGDPVVSDLRWLQYEPSGKIFFKINFDENLQEMPGRTKKIVGNVAFPALHRAKLLIPRDKWQDLQSLKVFMPSDVHSFYDNISHEEESRRLKRRQELNTKHDKKKKIKKLF